MTPRKKLVVWKPVIMFDPDDMGWQRLSDAERAFAKFFDEHGVEAEVMDVIGSPSDAIWCLSPKSQLDTMAEKPAPTVSNQLQKIYKNVRPLKQKP